MNRRLIAIGFFFLLILFSLTSDLSATPSSVDQICGQALPPVVARVDQHGISRADVFLRLESLPDVVPGKRLLKCRAALEESIQAALLRPIAESYSVEVSLPEIEAELSSLQSSFASEESFANFLSERQADLSDLRRVIEDRLLIKKFEERQIKSWVLSEELQQAYFDQHREELAKDRIKASHILVKTKKEAEQILLERNLKNLSFSELAVKYSLDEKTRQQGGDLGWIERGKMSPEFDAAAFSLEMGVINMPVKTSMGYHLILVEDKEPASEQTLEDHRPRVIRLLQEEEWAFQREEWWDEISEKSSVWITPELMIESEKPQETKAYAGQE
jgi:foldase protein PrsA